MRKILVFVLIIATLLCIMPLTVMAAPTEITVTAQSVEGKTDAEKLTIGKANGTALFNAIKGASDGDTIKVSEGYYYLNNNTSRIKTQNITIQGAGIGKTIIESEKYGFVLQYDGITDRKEITIKDMTISGKYHTLYIKNNVTAYLENLVLNTASDATILLDSSNTIGGASYNDITTIAYAENVTIEEGKKIYFNAAPASTVASSLDCVTYAKFFFENCTNIEEDLCEPQYCSIGFGNTSVNDIPLPAVTVPEDTTVEAGKTTELKATVKTNLATTFQWQVDKLDGNGFTNIDGATSDTYTVPALSKEQSGYKYRCVINGTLYSDETVITLKEEPQAPSEDTPKGEEKTPNPPTDDSTNTLLNVWAVLIVLSLIGVAVAMPLQKKINE